MNTGKSPRPAWPPQDGLISEAFLRLLQDGSWASYTGRHADALRAALQELHQASHCCLCSSGTAAMELALRGCRVGANAGDEVILSAYDFKSNMMNVLLVGAKPVLADTLPGLPVVDPERVRQAITERTRAIIVSHLHGFSGGVEQILPFAAERGIPVIEDACQAIGGLCGGRRAGSIGDVSIFSFGGSKLVTAGRGGAVLTSSLAIAQRIQLWQQRGNEAYPLSEMQAAILLPQLQMLESRTLIRMAGADRLQQLLQQDELLEPCIPPELRLASQLRPQGFLPAFYKLAFRLRDGISTDVREVLAARFQDEGLIFAPAFPALHAVHARSRWQSADGLENASALGSQLMTLHHPHLLQSPRDIDITAETIRGVTGRLAAEAGQRGKSG
ncbi:MAG: L-glutamine:2-deoxy-scyllo-inosose aminotransferase [Planctomycetota bacterium]